MELNIYTSRRTALMVFVLSALFVAAGIWGFMHDRDGDQLVINTLVIGLFGLGVPIGLFKLFDRRVQLRITEEGLWDRNLGPIRWEQIIRTYPVTVNRHKFISFQLSKDFEWKKPPYWWARMLNRSAGAQNANISVSWLAIDVGELFFILTSMRIAQPEHRAEVLRELIERFEII